MNILTTGRRGAWTSMLALALLAGCRLTSGGGADASIAAMATEPAEIALAQGQSGRAKVSFAVRIDNTQRPENGMRCDPLVGVPGGLQATLADCPTHSLSGTFDGTVSWFVDLKAITVAPGSYDIQVPGRVCLALFDDPSVGNDDERCRSATASLRVVITGVPSVPDAWRAVGDALNVAPPPVTTHGPALVVDAQARPVAAWVEDGRVVVRRWDGTAWQTLAAGLDTITANGRPALALMPDEGEPVVAWTEVRTAVSEAGEPMQVQLRRWNGTAWVAIPGLPAQEAQVQSAHEPALLARGGALFFAWAEQLAGEAGWRVRALYHFNGNWSEPFGSLPNPGPMDRVRLAANDTAGVALAWRDVTAGRIVVEDLRFSQPLVEIGRFPALNVNEYTLVSTAAYGLLLAIPPSPPATQFSVRRWDGNQWQDFGASQGLVATTAYILDVALGVEAVSGAPLLAWSQATPSQRLFVVRRWNGSAWIDLGEPLQAMGRSAPGTNFRVAVAGGTWPVVAMETSAGVPQADFGIRVSEFR